MIVAELCLWVHVLCVGDAFAVGWGHLLFLFVFYSSACYPRAPLASCACIFYLFLQQTCSCVFCLACYVTVLMAVLQVPTIVRCGSTSVTP